MISAKAKKNKKGGYVWVTLGVDERQNRWEWEAAAVLI